jgi:hypothetical protein
MINFIETLFGIAIIAGIAAIVMHVRKRPVARARMMWIAILAGVLGGLLEIYVRVV